MDDFRNDYNDNKKRGNGWVIALTCFSIVALILSTVALFRSNQILKSGNGNVENVGIKVGTTNANANDNVNIQAGQNTVVQVADSMKNKVVYVGVYGTSNSMSNNVQYSQIGSGSGFIISPEGYVVTNYHVIEEGKSFKITVNSNEVYDAKVVGYDNYSDLAVLKIEGADKKFDAVTVGDSNASKVGELAIAIGSPLGEALNNTVTVGYISAKNREITSNSHTTRMIQTDAAINPGNSGGPLINSSGQVIGINTMKSTFAGYDGYGNAVSADGISFAIPISDALPIITSIIEKGKYIRPGIGISYYTIDSEMANKNKVPQGLLIKSVNDNSPASKAGLKVDDIIVKVEDKDITKGTELNDVLAGKKVGDTINIVVYRDGGNKDIKLTLGDLSEITQQKENSNNKNENKPENKNNDGWIWPF